MFEFSTRGAGKFYATRCICVDEFMVTNVRYRLNQGWNKENINKTSVIVHNFTKTKLEITYDQIINIYAIIK